MELVSITKIKPAKYNPRRIDDDAFAGLCESLKKFGMPQPLVVNSRSGVLVSGHQRLKAAESLGWAEVPVVYVDLSDAEEKALNVTLNNRHIGGDYTEGVADVLAEIREALGDDFMESLRLDEIEVPEVEVIPGEEESDEAPEPPAIPKSKLGDLWMLGSHRLLCGDSTDILAVERLMDGKKADMVFTDPPYGISYQNNASKRFDVIENDDKILPVASVVWASMKNDSAAFVWTAQSVYPTWRDQFSDFYKSTIIWKKNGGQMGDLSGDFLCNYEMALFCIKGRPTFRGKRELAVWEFDRDVGKEYVHPTQKPVSLAEHAMSCFTDPNQSVLDLFGGSGSTLIACEKTKRQCFMMELDPKYVDVILQRWATYTGLDPVRDDGMTWSQL